VDGRVFIAGTLGLLAAPLAAEAHAVGKVARMGILRPSTANAGEVTSLAAGRAVPSESSWIGAGSWISAVPAGCPRRERPALARRVIR
jgi:hypothetical protein